MPRQWVGEVAGPLLLLPDSLLAEWSGINVPEYREVHARARWNPEELRASDYDRASDVQDEAAAVSVAYGEGLVLSGGLRPTTWQPTQWGGYVVRWEYADGEADVERALARIPSSLSWKPLGALAVVSTPSTLFNASEPGTDIVMPRLEIELAPGSYGVRWTMYDPDERTELTLVELRRSST